MAPKGLALIAGVGPGTGAAIARQFAQAYTVALLSRNPSNTADVIQSIRNAGGTALGVSADVTSAESLQGAVAEIARLHPNAPLAAAVFNAGSPFKRAGFLELSERDFAAGLDVTRGAFLFAQTTIPLLLKAIGQTPYPPTLIFTGATASVRGSAKFASFAPSKFALRGLSQSLAREFGPQGIHVAHTIIDAVIDTNRVRNYIPTAESMAKEGKLMEPDSIANSYWYLHTQDKSAFTQELDLRPYAENW